MKIFRTLMLVMLCAALLLSLAVCARADASAALYDRSGVRLREDNFSLYKAAADAFSERLSAGESVYLTLSLELQQAAHEILGEAPDGCAVVLDVNTGEPLALVSVGGLDPLKSVFSPGRLFTPCTALAAMSDKLIDPAFEIACEGVYTRYADDGWAPECWIWNAVEGQHFTHPAENTSSALRDGCDYYFYCLGNELGIDALADFAASMGLGQATGIELAENTGVTLSRDSLRGDMPWRIGDTLDASVGRSVGRFSPLQLARFCAAIANGGRVYSSSVLYESDKDGGIMHLRQPELTSEAPAMDESCWEAVRQGMYLYLTSPLREQNGLFDTGFAPAGLASADESGTELFMCFAPAESPEIAVFTASNGSAGSAGRMACDIAAAYFDMY